MAAERQSGMLELCQNYAGAMRGFLDPCQKRLRSNEDYQLSPLAHALFLRPILGVCGAPVKPRGNGGGDEFHYFCHGLGGLDRPFGMLELCRNYAGAMLEFLDPYQKRPRPEEALQAFKI